MFTVNVSLVISCFIFTLPSNSLHISDVETNQGGNARLMQVRLQRINVADIPGLRNQVAAAMAAAGAAQRGQSAATDEPTIGDVATTDVAAAADATATPAANDAAGELWRHSLALIEWGQHTSLTFTTRA